MMRMTVLAALLGGMATGCGNESTPVSCTYDVPVNGPADAAVDGFDGVGSYADTDVCTQYCLRGYTPSCQLVSTTMITCIEGCG